MAKYIKQAFGIVFLITLVLTTGIVVTAAKGAPPATNINVTSTLSDNDAFGAALYTRSDDYPLGGASQSSATYTATGGITSQVITGGGWQLYLGSQTLRTVCLTLGSQGVHDGTTVIPDGCYSANTEVGSRCFTSAGAEIAFTSIAAGTSQNNCTFVVDFSYGRTKYKLAMGPNFANTGRAQVACNAADSTGTCDNWTIIPSTVAANPTVANVYAFGKNGTLVLLGAYHNTYKVAVTNP